MTSAVHCELGRLRDGSPLWKNRYGLASMESNSSCLRYNELGSFSIALIVVMLFMEESASEEWGREREAAAAHLGP